MTRLEATTPYAIYTQMKTQYRAVVRAVLQSTASVTCPLAHTSTLQRSDLGKSMEIGAINDIPDIAVVM
jgi:hypothetical protein